MWRWCHLLCLSENLSKIRVIKYVNNIKEYSRVELKVHLYRSLAPLFIEVVSR